MLSRVLVTGGSGFVGSYCVLQLLEKGYRVRATIRNLQNEHRVREMLDDAGADTGEKLEFVAADLEHDEGWQEAVEGCEYVLHIASPFPSDVPKDEDELIIPARDGALRVLRAACNSGVKRVVLTSSFAAIGYGHPHREEAYDESSWTDINGEGMSAYIKSKTIAEKAAWDFVQDKGGSTELSVINPVGIFGPVMGPDFSTSISLVQMLMNGMPGCPRLHYGIVDVRDVADLHIRAMTGRSAAGQRFLATASDSMSVVEVARILKERLGGAARRVPTRELPDVLVKLLSYVNPKLKQVVPQLGRKRHLSNEKARRLLEWNPRPAADSLVATAESLVRFGLVKA